MLKPIYARLYNSSQWYSLAKSSICYSDNAATDILVNPHLGNLHKDLTRVAALDFSPASTWGQIIINTEMVTSLYEKLRVSQDSKSILVKSLMYNVSPYQKFEVSGAVKAGWDLYYWKDVSVLTTHVVQLSAERTKVFLSSEIVDENFVSSWKKLLDKNGPTSVIKLHKEVAQEDISKFFKLK